ncbi:MAG: flagellar hook-basal body complex protein [Helicobacteraceae bacterium]|jgi:flagellar hook-basal body protein|nr:flagellar hook-basal body complex protein [Helicobacteraceae bacterium]
MNGGFWTALTGAKTQQNAIDTTANNIANINTTGYRASAFEFAALFSRSLAVNAKTVSSDDGVGTRTSATSIDLRSGTYVQSDGVFDVAITDDGWFGVIGSNIYDAKQVAYTRDGAFSRDANGALVTQSGHYVLGTSWGAMINEGGVWKIDPSAEIGSLASVSAQTSIIAPNDPIYPPIATKTASLNANLPNPAAKTAAANNDAPIVSLYGGDGVYMGLKAGDNMLIAAGDNAGVYVALGEIRKTISVNDAINSPLSFTLNGENISVSWAAAANENVIAEAIAEAINLSGAANATHNGANVAISSPNALSIANSSDPFLSALNAAIWTADANDSLSDLQAAIAQTARAIYSEIDSFINYEGKIAVKNDKNLSLLVANGGATPEALLRAFSAFDGAEKTAIYSANFAQSTINAEQKAVAPNGDQPIISSSLRLVAPADANGGATYAIAASLKRLETASGALDLSAVAQSGKALGLRGGEDLWFAFGTPPISSERGLGYSLALSDDLSDGSPPLIRFTLDGASYEYNGADGDDFATIAAGISAALAAEGYETSVSDASLIIYPRGDSLYFAGGESSLIAANFAPSSFGRVEYSSGETIGEYIDEINRIADLIGASASVDNGKINLSNGSGQTIVSGVYNGDNTPEALGRLFSSFNASLAANASVSSAALEGYATLSTQNGLITLSANGEVVGDEYITLDNDGSPLNVQFKLTADNGLSENANIYADGVIEGRLEGYSIDEFGRVTATFDNGRQSAIAQIAVYHFANDGGLMRIGANQFMQSGNSGAPFFYLDANGAQLSCVQGGALESSNVQSAIALSDLIVYQRAYEGAARAITTNDQLIQNAINLKR